MSSILQNLKASFRQVTSLHVDNQISNSSSYQRKGEDEKKLPSMILKPILLVLLFLSFGVSTAFAHVWEIRVNQESDGSLTWYLQSYHRRSQCGIQNSGLTVNGKRYPLLSEHSGSAAGLSNTVFAKTSYNYSASSYAIVRTPDLGNQLSVAPYSSNVCWAFMVGGNANFTPPPPACTSFPVTGWSNAVIMSANNNNTPCDNTDDYLPTKVSVSHQTCATVTGDGKFSLVLDVAGKNKTFGPYAYASGTSTNVNINLPYGTAANAQLRVIDNDFPGAESTHGLAQIPSPYFSGSEDTTPPNAMANDITLRLSQGGLLSADYINRGSTDNCTSYQDLSLSVDKSKFTCADVGENIVTLTVTDAAGNKSKATATVTVIDDVSPSALAKDIVVQLDVNGNARIKAEDIDNKSSDECGSVSLDLNKSSLDCSNIGDNTVKLIVTDSNGNVSTADAIVTVKDGAAPKAIAQDISVTLAGGAASITSEMINNGSSDNCGIAFMTVDRKTFDCSSIGENTVTLTVTDNSGNESTATAIVNVIGATPALSIAATPSNDVNTGGDAKTIYLGYGPQSVMLTASNATSEAGVSSYTWAPANGLSSTSIANPVFTPTSAGIYYFTVTAINEYGCQSSADIAINVVDAACGKKGNKVLVCHKGKEICIASSAVQAHLAHGCTLGACSTNAVQSVSSSNNIGLQESDQLVAFPNPFSNQTNFEFSMNNAGKYRLELYDVRGALMSVVAEGVGEAGSYHSFEISGNKLKEGIYVVRLVTADGVRNAKIIKSR